MQGKEWASTLRACGVRCKRMQANRQMAAVTCALHVRALINWLIRTMLMKTSQSNRVAYFANAICSSITR